MTGLRSEGQDYGVESTQFVKDYRRLSKKLENSEFSTWNDYIADKQNWQQFLKLKYNISILENEPPFDTDVFEFAKDSLKQMNRMSNSGSGKTVEALNHDSKLFSYVVGMRNGINTRPVLGPYVLSFDNLITAVSEIDADKYWAERIAIQPRNWLNYLLAFTPAELSSNERKEASLALLEIATSFEGTLSIEEYTRLLVPKVGLNSGDESVLPEYLVNHPKRRKLERALENDHGIETERVVIQMLGDEDRIKRFSKERKMETKLKKASSNYQQAQQRYMNERERRKALEESMAYNSFSGDQTINITVSSQSNSTVDIESINQFNSQLNSFIQLLDDTLIDGIDGSPIPNPPEDESNIEKVSGWLRDLSVELAASGVSSQAQALKPMAEQLLDQAHNLL